MTVNRIDSFEAWVRSVEKRIVRLERKPLGGGAGGGGGGAVGAAYNLVFLNGVSAANPPVGVSSQAFVVGSFTFESGEEVGMAVSMIAGVAWVRAPVSDGTYPSTLIFVEP